DRLPDGPETLLNESVPRAVASVAPPMRSLINPRSLPLAALIHPKGSNHETISLFSNRHNHFCAGVRKQRDGILPIPAKHRLPGSRCERPGSEDRRGKKSHRYTAHWQGVLRRDQQDRAGQVRNCRSGSEARDGVRLQRREGSAKGIWRTRLWRETCKPAPQFDRPDRSPWSYIRYGDFSRQSNKMNDLSSVSSVPAPGDNSVSQAPIYKTQCHLASRCVIP